MCETSSNKYVAPQLHREHRLGTRYIEDLWTRSCTDEVRAWESQAAKAEKYAYGLLMCVLTLCVYRHRYGSAQRAPRGREGPSLIIIIIIIMIMKVNTNNYNITVIIIIVLKGSPFQMKFSEKYRIPKNNTQNIIRYSRRVIAERIIIIITTIIAITIIVTIIISIINNNEY